jgi:hypothetical protein
VITLEKNLEKLQNETIEVLNRYIRSEWDKQVSHLSLNDPARCALVHFLCGCAHHNFAVCQCSLEALKETAAESSTGKKSTTSTANNADLEANAQLIAKLSACLTDDDPPPPASPTSPEIPVEPLPPSLTPSLLETSSKIFSSWKAFSPYRMRSVVIPHQAIDAFMFAAHANTLRNIETCAILGGLQCGESLVISTVIVPQQKGTRQVLSELV